MLYEYREIIAVCSEIHTKHSVDGTQKFLNVKLSGTYSNQWALNCCKWIRRTLRTFSGINQGMITYKADSYCIQLHKESTRSSAERSLTFREHPALLSLQQTPRCSLFSSPSLLTPELHRETGWISSRAARVTRAVSCLARPTTTLCNTNGSRKTQFPLQCCWLHRF